MHRTDGSLLASNGNARAAGGRGRERLDTMATTMPFVATLRRTNQPTLVE